MHLDVLLPSIFYILEEFEKYWYLFFKCLVEFTIEATLSRAFNFLGVVGLFNFLFLPKSVLVGCMFLGIYQLPIGCPICWYIILHSSLLLSFVFLWYQLLTSSL